MNTPVIIRAAREDEQDAITRLTLAAYGEYAHVMAPMAWAALRQALEAALASNAPAQRIVAEQDGVLVGSVMLYPPAVNAYGDLLAGPDWPELRLLAVAQAARGQGVGQALIDECVRRAQQQGASAIGLHSSDTMQIAIRMYKRMGFVRVPEYDFQPAGAELVKAYRRNLI